MRRALSVAFAALLAHGCADEHQLRFEHPLDGAPTMLHLDPDGCAKPTLDTVAPLSSSVSSTRLRNISDARTDPAQVGAIHDPKHTGPTALLQDPHAPLDLALGRRLARSLAAPQMPDLVVADVTLREAWVESRGGTARASFGFAVVPIMLQGRLAPVEFRGSVSANDADASVAQSQKYLQTAFCDATNKFDAWLAGTPRL